MIWRFSNIFKVRFTFHDFCIPKPTKRSLQVSQRDIASKLLLLFKTYIRVLDKIVSAVIFVIFAIIFKVIFNFANVFTSKNPKIATGSLNSCDIVWIWVYPVEYLSRFLTKLLVKLRFGDFQIFLEFLHPFLHSKSHPQKSQIFEKSVVASDCLRYMFLTKSLFKSCLAHL